jgi:PIN domain
VAYRPATFELGRQLRLKHPIQPDHALEVLRELTSALDQLIMDGRSYDAVMRTRDNYLEWVELTEIKLSELTHDRAVVEQLHTPRYWEIRRLVPSDARPIPLIDGECRAQRDALQGMRENLEMHVNRARSAPGHITVLDTNSLLHYQLPNSIKWPEIVGQEQVRLVIPLRVIEELDAKKWGDGSEKLRDRARALLPKLDALIGPGGAPAPLADGVTIEVPVEYLSGQPRVKPEDADEEILFTCRELWQLSGQPEGVTLITGDVGMRIRAEALGGVRPVKLPDSYLRNRDGN